MKNLIYYSKANRYVNKLYNFEKQLIKIYEYNKLLKFIKFYSKQIKN